MENQDTLPDFIVIGAMKAGTTTLYEYLQHHPEIGMSRIKETNFFVEEKNWRRGLKWYRKQFPTDRKLRGEVSPNYTKSHVFKGVVERMKTLVPNCKFIFLARDPVARAQSQYRHELLSDEVPPPPPEDLPGTHSWSHLIDTSAYAKQLEVYLAHYPRENFLFLEFESFVENPVETLSEIAAFLEIEDSWPINRKIAANAHDTESRMPGWYFQVRRSRTFGRLKDIIPPSSRTLLKRLVRKTDTRPIEGFTPEVKTRFAEEIRDDTARFRQLAGRSFSRWRV